MNNLMFLVLFIAVLVLASNVGIIFVISILLSRINTMIESLKDIITIINNINNQVSERLIETTESRLKKGGIDYDGD